MNTYTGNGSSVTKAEIDDYCSIGTNVLIGPGEHDHESFSTSALLYGNDAYDFLISTPI